MPIFSPDALARYTQAVPADTQPAPASTPATSNEAIWPYLALYGGQGADLATTYAALRNPDAHETNPLGAAGMTAAKLGVTAALTWLMHHEHEQGNDKAQKVIGTLGGILGLGPSIWNIVQMQKAK
jgi:hypothetical protein